MKNTFVLSLVVFFLSITISAFSQNTGSSSTTIEKKVSPKGNTFVIKKKSNLPSSKLQIRPIPGNTDKYRQENNVPADFPKYKDTGNPKLDAENYYQAKQIWIKNHPTEFQKIKHLSL